MNLYFTFDLISHTNSFFQFLKARSIFFLNLRDIMLIESVHRK